MNRKIGELLRYGMDLLKQSGVNAYSTCAEALLIRATGFIREKLLAEQGLYVGDDCVRLYVEFLDRCANNEPLQYILNTCEFMSLDFYVDSNVLIPRQDTETLVETALKALPRNARILEIGTGSGCIAVSIAKYRPDLHVTAIDISRRALAVARSNALKHNVQAEFAWCDIRKSQFIGLEFDAIVSNPPYIRTGDIASLNANVRDYEPKQALDGGEDGLDFYRVISNHANRLPESNKGLLKHSRESVVLYEIGFDQAEGVGGILRNNGFDDIVVIKDLAGYDRVIMARLMT